jgi:ATP-binding protein involved in chromosome partitioning
MVTKDDIIKLFDTIVEPKLKWNINSLGLLKNIELTQDALIVDIDLVEDDQDQIEQFRLSTLEVLSQVFKGEITLNIQKAYIAKKGIDGVKHIILVASGKGGVGKSTVSVNLASALMTQGFKVGLMDADIYGPSLPIMLGVTDKKPSVLEDENLKPIEVHNMKFISIGSLVPKDKAISWRGQLASGTILQFLQKTAWEELDFLVIDMPPGTGDIHLTIASQIKPDAVVVVTTPQEVVWGDVRRSIDLLRDEKVPIVGIVENMSYTVCQECGHTNHPFHSTKDTIKDIDIIAKLPLVAEVSKTADSGTPIVIEDKNTQTSQEYIKLASIVNDYVNNQEEK